MAHPNVKLEVELDKDQRAELEVLVRKGTASARQVRQARVLLLADEGNKGDGSHY